jgi:hypothetical protein
MRAILVFSGLCMIAAGCSMSSDVMDTGGGTYVVSAQASPLRGGSEQAAHEQAVKYCASHRGGHPVVLGVDHPIGNRVSMHFRCGS